MSKNIQFDYNFGVKLIRNTLNKLPNGSGVYKFKNLYNEILYIGKAKNLKKRVSSYTNLSKHSNRIKLLISSVKKIDFIKTHTESDSLILENNLIKKFKPRFNIRLIDDKSYPYILISTSKDWPQIRKYRGKINKKNSFFGPFSSANSVDNILKQIEAAFLLRNCSDRMFSLRKRPCIKYQIKRCSAPCVGLISKEKYEGLVKEAVNFLKGKNIDYKKNLIKEMEIESKLQNYEKAASLRDRIKALSKITNERYSDINSDEDFDIIFIKDKYEMVAIQVFSFRKGKNLGNKSFLFSDLIFDKAYEILEQFIMFFYSQNTVPKEIFLNEKLKNIDLFKNLLSKNTNYKVRIKLPLKGKKKELMEMVENNVDVVLNKRVSAKKKEESILYEIKNTLNLSKDPNRIEIYDNSHLNGTNPTGAMVTYEDLLFQKNSYRKFNIKTTKGKVNDDYFMMRQVFERRFKFDKDWKRKIPDLIIIDGGRGHLNTVKKILEKLKIHDLDIIAISKGVNRNKGEESVHTNEKSIKFDRRSENLFFLQRLRDEAHRFAISSTKLRHTKSLKTSVFDKIEGLGTKTKSNLLSYFGSIDNIKTASIGDLKKVPNIGTKMARKLYYEFNRNV